VLWVTNDLPPRAGGIQQFVGNLLDRVDPDTTLVVGPGPGGDDPAEVAAHDAAAAYAVIRRPGVVLPTRATRDAVVAAARDHDAEVVVLGASWPLGELAGPLRRRVDVPVVALSHGLEAGLAKVGGGPLLARASRHLAAVTTISDFTEAALRPHLRSTLVRRVPPGVDVERFHPQVDGTALRARWGVPADAPVVGCVSRLVRRKGQDVLLDLWPAVRRRRPDAWLVLVGEGPLEAELRARAAALGPGAQVVVTGRVAWDELPAAHAALDLFVMPCRTRLGGTDVEGLGIVYLEAQACGVPAIAGRSGGAPEAVRAEVTGSVVDGTDPRAVAATIGAWLDDPDARAAAGRAGRAWVERRWSWPAIAADLRGLLAEVVGA
jgi:phosphatidylinositol alpha-1,6-mannosyltransferase